MGLDIGLETWETAYSMHFGYAEFGVWRDTLMEAAGYTFIEVEGSYGARKVPNLDYDSFQVDKELHGFWYEDPEDPLVYIYWHSDCDGGLSLYQLNRLIPRIEEIRDLVPNNDYPNWSHRNKLDEFYQLCWEAIERNEGLVFS